MNVMKKKFSHADLWHYPRSLSLRVKMCLLAKPP